MLVDGVDLGSGLLKGLAREAALKLLKLSDGALVTAFDTALGFRHSPMTIVTDRTLVVVFVSNDPLTRRYDLDIIEELRGDGRSGRAAWHASGAGVRSSATKGRPIGSPCRD